MTNISFVIIVFEFYISECLEKKVILKKKKLKNSGGITIFTTTDPKRS